MSVRVVAVDIGSIRPPSNFAWAAFDAPGRAVAAEGDSPETAVSALLAGFQEDRQVALLLESPVSVPVPPVQHDSWRTLGAARDGEGNRPWSAGAGSAALATGLAQGAWMLLSLAAAIPGLTVTTQPRRWRGGHARLLLAEAFVSGAGKPPPLPAGQHAADAAAVALALLARLDTAGEITSDVRCSPLHPFNLLAAMAIWAGLHIDGTEIRQDVLVIRCTPPT
jgi:hypothetical protein